MQVVFSFGKFFCTGRHSDDSDEGKKDKRRRSQSPKKDKDGKRHKDDDNDDKNDNLEVEDYWFFCKRWLAKDEDDKETIRELIASDEQGKALDPNLVGR